MEIISHNDSIWFIDVEEKYWYFEFEKSGRLWWRYYFFDTFFKPFSLLQTDYEWILASWVEEVLNHKVSTTEKNFFHFNGRVEEVLNHKVTTTQLDFGHGNLKVEEVLNHKVTTTRHQHDGCDLLVEDVLNQK